MGDDIFIEVIDGDTLRAHGRSVSARTSDRPPTPIGGLRSQRKPPPLIARRNQFCRREFPEGQTKGGSDVACPLRTSSCFLDWVHRYRLVADRSVPEE